MWRLALVIVLMLVGGCNGVGPQSGPLATGDPPTGSTANTHRPLPTGLFIPAIGARSGLIPLGLDKAGALVAPPVTQPMQAGYYRGAKQAAGDEVLPGELGPAIIAGHVDGEINHRKGQPGIFFRLRDLVVNDDIFIDREDGTRLRFVVYATARVSKDAFPSVRVYGNTDNPELRLITCGGAFDRTKRSYVDNIIVFAVLVRD